MAQLTSIEWTDVTWNPIRGCSRVSEGCRNCYAERVAARFSGPGQPYEGLAVMAPQGPRWTGKLKLVEKVLYQPLRWQEPRRVFVNSMSDLFHEALPEDSIDRVFAVMANTQYCTYQVLTKRPERMLEYMRALLHKRERMIDLIWEQPEHWVKEPIEKPTGEEVLWFFPEWPPTNVWLGVSVEDQATADERIPLLLQTPAAVRFVSYEPALGPVDFTNLNLMASMWRFLPDALKKANYPNYPKACKLDALRGDSLAGKMPLLNWVICGGESGPGARPMHPNWARSVRDQCQSAGVPFFFKQWGEWAPSFDFKKQFEGINPTTPCKLLAADGHAGHSQAEMEGHPRVGLVVKTGKKNAGRLLDGREWNEFPRPGLDAEG